jgi:hypothetical protein
VELVWKAKVTAVKRQWKKFTFSPPTLPKVHFSFLNFKIGQITSLNFSNRVFYLPRAVLKAGGSKTTFKTARGR